MTRCSWGPGVPGAATRHTRSAERWVGGDGATGSADSTKEPGRISRASEASGTRPRQTCDAQAEGAPWPHGADAAHRWRGEGLRGREARTRLSSRADGERHRRPCAGPGASDRRKRGNASRIMRIRSRGFSIHFLQQEKPATVFSAFYAQFLRSRHF